MSGTIIPLRPRGDERYRLARVDHVAGELMATGRSADLQTARIEAILMDLRAQRDRMATVLVDLCGRQPTGDACVDAANAELVLKIDQGITQIDLFIARAGLLDG